MEVATRPEDLDKISDSASLLMKRKLLGLGAGFLRSTTGRGVRAGEVVVILCYCRMNTKVAGSRRCAPTQHHAGGELFEIFDPDTE